MKKKIAIITTVAVLAVAAIGSTLAYFNATTDLLENRMVASTGFYDDEELLIDLYEEFGYGELETNETAYPTYKGGDTVPTIEKVVPGSEITKRPYIQNDSELDAYVAVLIEVNDAVNDFADMDFNTTDWTFVTVDANTIVAYYNTVLAAGTSTTDLFTTVTIDSTLDDSTLPDGTQINIDLTGYAVQSRDNTNTTSVSAIDAQFGSELGTPVVPAP